MDSSWKCKAEGLAIVFCGGGVGAVAPSLQARR